MIVAKEQKEAVVKRKAVIVDIFKPLTMERLKAKVVPVAGVVRHEEHSATNRLTHSVPSVLKTTQYRSKNIFEPNISRCSVVLRDVTFPFPSPSLYDGLATAATT